MDQRTHGIGRSGKIILLGDGKILTDSDDTEMFDHDEEDKDLESQVPKRQANPKGENHETRSEIRESPGPQTLTTKYMEPTTEGIDTDDQITSEKPTAGAKVVPNSALPEKLVTPSKTN